MSVVEHQKKSINTGIVLLNFDILLLILYMKVNGICICNKIKMQYPNKFPWLY